MSNEKKVLAWLESGDVGRSSKFLAFSFLGMKADYGHPLDPSDINRCFQLMKKIPEIKSFLPEMASKSKEWRILVDNWSKIEELFIQEVGDNWSKGSVANKTYEMMKEIGID